MIKMEWHYPETSPRAVRRKFGGGVKQAIAGKLISTAAAAVAEIVHIVAESECWLAITILLQQILLLPWNGIMKEMMGNCQNILRSAARKKSGGNVTKAIAGFPLSIIVHLEMAVPIAAAGML